MFCWLGILKLIIFWGQNKIINQMWLGRGRENNPWNSTLKVPIAVFNIKMYHNMQFKALGFQNIEIALKSFIIFLLTYKGLFYFYHISQKQSCFFFFFKKKPLIQKKINKCTISQCFNTSFDFWSLCCNMNHSWSLVSQLSGLLITYIGRREGDGWRERKWC